MKMKPEEITAIIKKQIEDYNVEMNVDDVGTVLEVGDGIAHIYGLDKAMSGELLELPHGVYGMALNLEEDNVGAVLLGDDALIKEGDTVRRTGRVMRVPVGEAMIGRVVNPLGMPIDGKGEIKTKESRLIEVKAFGIADRQPVKVPLQTGLKAIDSMVPIGRGQRELIIGDRGTGKTAIAIDTILNQKDTGVICVYVAIGQKASTVARVVRTLEENGAMAYTIVVAATASDGAPLQYLAPYSGVSMAEYFMLQGKDCLCVYDDLSKHAQAYRAMSLLLRRPPGRGNVLSIHKKMANDPKLLQAFSQQFAICKQDITHVPAKYMELMLMLMGCCAGNAVTIKTHGELAVKKGATMDEVGEVLRLVFFYYGASAIIPAVELFEELEPEK